MIRLSFGIVVGRGRSPLRVLIVGLMYRELRERESDAFLVEGFIDHAVHVEHYVPVVTAFSPYAYLDVYAAGRKRTQSDERSRCLEDSFISSDNAFQYGFHPFVVFS